MKEIAAQLTTARNDDKEEIYVNKKNNSMS